MQCEDAVLIHKYDTVLSSKPFELESCCKPCLTLLIMTKPTRKHNSSVDVIKNDP